LKKVIYLKKETDLKRQEVLIEIGLMLEDYSKAFIIIFSYGLMKKTT
jgi:hypothetical protein